MMISSTVPHSRNEFVNFALFNLKGTLKQDYPRPYQVEQKSRLKRNVPLKKRFLLLLKVPKHSPTDGCITYSGNCSR